MKKPLNKVEIQTSKDGVRYAVIDEKVNFDCPILLKRTRPMKLAEKLIYLLFPQPTDFAHPERWHSEVEDEHLEIDALKFVFSQAEKKLDDSIKAFDATTGKSISIITLGTGLFLAQASYFFLNNDINGTFNPKLATVFCSCLLTFGILYRILFNVTPTNYKSIGSDPSRLFTKKFFSKDTVGLSALHLYANEIESYQVAIRYNFDLNRIRLNRLRETIALLLLLPIADLALYGICGFVVSLF